MLRYRIYPSKKEAQKLGAILEECRWLYNHLLEKRRDAYEQGGKGLTLYQQQATYSILKQERPSLNKVHSQVLQNAAWSEFFNKLAAKAEEAGRTYVAVNPAYTSQDCSRCHHRQTMPLNVRIYECPCCGLHLDRDHNASLNILSVRLHALGSQTRRSPGHSA